MAVKVMVSAIMTFSVLRALAQNSADRFCRWEKEMQGHVSISFLSSGLDKREVGGKHDTWSRS